MPASRGKHPADCGHCAAVRGSKRPDIAGDRSPSKRPEVRAKISASTKKGADHPAWKATKDLCYKKLHARLRAERWSGECAHCGAASHDLCLVDGRGKYTLDAGHAKPTWCSDDRNDYIELCDACHGSYDAHLKPVFGKQRSVK